MGFKSSVFRVSFFFKRYIFLSSIGIGGGGLSLQKGKIYSVDLSEVV